MRILITNIVVLNGGDGAILFGMIAALKRVFGANSEFIVFASEPKAAKRMYPEIQFRETLGLAATRAPKIRYIGRVVRVLRSSLYILCAWCYAHNLRSLSRLFLGPERTESLATYARADMIISSGGTYLKEDYGLESQICDYRICQILNKPLAFYTQSLGPFTQPRYRSALKPIFESAFAVLLRDQQSLNNLKEIKVHSDRLFISPDAAFALANPSTLGKARNRAFPQNRPLRIALSVRRWAHFTGLSASQGMEKYIEMMARVVLWLVSDLKGEVTFLSTCQGNPEYDDDSAVARQITGRLDSEWASQVKITTEFVRFDKLLELLPDFDLVIATRMHMTILSLMSGTPAIALALEFKTRELFMKLGMGVIDVEEFDANATIQHIQHFLEVTPKLRGQLFDRVEQERISAMEAAFHLEDGWNLQAHNS